jgi:hypothetical protein
MSSARKIRANQMNARASTGPKTSDGRARVSRNALRHGLNVPLQTDPTFSEQIEALANKLAGPLATPELHALAIEVAETQIDLQRARSARYRALLAVGDARQLAGDTRNVGKAVRNVLSSALNDPQGFATIVDVWTEQLVAIERYIRRTHSRRQLAVQAFERVREYSAARKL